MVQKLINQDRVAAVVGEVASSRSLAAGPICQQAGVPMISPSSTNPEVTKKVLINMQRALLSTLAASNQTLDRAGAPLPQDDDLLKAYIRVYGREKGREMLAKDGWVK